MKTRIAAAALSLGALISLPVGDGSFASSHREAPFITRMPKVDGTDFYMFRSWEAGREDYVTLIANYQPVQSPYGGPNFYMMDPDALYEIHVDNTGDAQEDVTFQFRFQHVLKGANGIELPVGTGANMKMVAIPLVNSGKVTSATSGTVNLRETYTINVVRGNRRTGAAMPVTKAGGAVATFEKPLDNIGNKTFDALTAPNVDYGMYANNHIHNLSIPGCTPPGGSTARVFVGQRAEAFSVNLGQIFDLFNFSPIEAAPGPTGFPEGPNTLGGANVTSIAIEVPISCLVSSAAQPIVGGWTTASLRQARVLSASPTLARPSKEGGAWVQVSRLGMPLVNEVVIGLKDKDKFNGSHPSGDGQFADYVTNPTLPELLEIVYGAAAAPAPDVFPRADLVTAFLTGVPSVNKMPGNTLAEMLRLNTAITAKQPADQNEFGAAGCFVAGVLTTAAATCDTAGFPNGRRPGDDVVDISLRVAMGYLLTAGRTAASNAPLTDQAPRPDAMDIAAAFPYLGAANPGSP